MHNYTNWDCIYGYDDNISIMNRNDFLETIPIEYREWAKRINSVLLSGKNFTASGFATTPPEILAEREATCRACSEWDAAALNNTGRCRKCGCSTWAKLRMATERCPLGKWEAVTAASAEPRGSLI